MWSDISRIKTVIVAAFILTVVIGTAFGSSSGMCDNPRTSEEWMQAHTVNVTSTTTYKYEQRTFVINETYTGEELKGRFGIEHFKKELRIPVEDNVLVKGKVLGLQEGEERIFVTGKATVLTGGDDPLQWWDNYSYPQWTWSKSGDIYEKEDPINLAWKNTTKDLAKSEILEEGWADWGTWYNFYVYDPIYGWIADDNVADDPVGLFGRYHARLWQMSEGSVVANAHHDSAVPHEANEIEEAEELVAEFFNESEDTEWNVYEDSYNLGNNVTSPYSDGWCTQISYGIFFDAEAPANPYPSLCGNHNGTITPSRNISVTKLYTYPCQGTGGHMEYARIWNSSWDGVEAHWNGYTGDWHNLTFSDPFILRENETHNYTIKTSSYPQIIHETSLNVTGGTITCDKFTDINGVDHYGWIPAIKFF